MNDRPETILADGKIRDKRSATDEMTRDDGGAGDVEAGERDVA
jgi:hypothetical protein